MNLRRIAFLILLLAMAGVYLVMVLWSLPRIAAEAGGQPAFDLRPTGYSFEEAKAFLAALTPEGKRVYAEIQHRLDLVYPALLAATLFFAIVAISPTNWGAMRYVLALIAPLGMVFDYLENAAVARMLDAGAEGLTPEMVAQASRYTIIKSAATSAAFVLLLVLLALAFWRRRSRAR